MLPEVRIDPELLLETLVGDDRVRGQLDAEAIGVLVTDAAAGERRRAGAHAVALEHDDAAGAESRQVIGRAHAHDAGADDRHIRGLGHGHLPQGFSITLIARSSFLSKIA